RSLACRPVVDDMFVVNFRACEQRFCRVSGWFSATNRTLCGILLSMTNCWSQIETVLRCSLKVGAVSADRF
ncbi:hypothetical protein, partial [Mycobacterium simiae]|uniref:hypothetical protein n=1 Tax=Mycobacterium simiae TaxID=1784 RepID=UPI0026353556